MYLKHAPTYLFPNIHVEIEIIVACMYKIQQEPIQENRKSNKYPSNSHYQETNAKIKERIEKH